MKKEEVLKTNMVKRFITMLMSICILLGSIAGYADVVLAAEYDSDETVIETNSLNKSGKAIFNGKVIEGGMLPDLHEGIIRLLDDETEVVASLMYGNDKYVNGQSIFSDSYIQINVGEAQLSNIIVAEEDIIINASTMCSDEYTIIYSKSGNIRFNIGEMDFNGIIYAPHGEVTFSASQVHMGGRIIADEVNIYAGVFQIDGLEEYRNIVNKIELLTNDIILEISNKYVQKNNKYSIDITSQNEEEFEHKEVYIRYDEQNEFVYLCELNDLENVGIESVYDTVDLVVKGITRFNEIVFSNVRSFLMDEEEVLYAHLDTDEDGIADGEEILYTKTNPYKADSDEDEISDYIECFYLLTDPNAKTADGDYDNDGLSDFEELEQGTNPFLPDCDMDGLIDGFDNEPLKYSKTNIQPKYESVRVVTSKYDKILNGCDEEGNSYQYIYNVITEQIKSICYSDKEIYYFYDADSKLISDIRKYEDEYRVSSREYDENGNVIVYSNNGNIYEYKYDEYSNVISASLNGVSIYETTGDDIQYGNGDEFVVEENDNGYTYCINGIETYIVMVDEEQGIEKKLHKKTGLYYEYTYVDEALVSISTNAGYNIKYTGNDEEYIVAYEYGGVNKQQTIDINSESHETSLITEDVYKSYTVEESMISSIMNGENTIFKVEYVTLDDCIVTILYNDEQEVSYIYNENNQITSVMNDGEEVLEYEYNSIGQLISEYDFVRQTVEKYSYDIYNNIERVEKYTYDGVMGEIIDIDEYMYQSEICTDRITQFNGVEISYDEIGNPLEYFGGKKFEWSGRQLEKIRTSQGTTEYLYDNNGIRVQKNIDGKIVNYYYEGEDIILETSNENVIWYIYDDSTNILGFTCNEKNYYYVKNANKDVIAIIDEIGNYICGYYYDAWGNLLGVDGDKNIAKLNPIRYRSYYYDEESGFYYLKSRYYDPEIRRFISMDDICDVAYEMVDPNLYAYCCNDPVNLYDPEGRAYAKIALFVLMEFFVYPSMCLQDDLTDAWGKSWVLSMMGSDIKQDFIDWWNRLEDQDIVILFIHGNPNALMTKDDKYDLYINTSTVSSSLKNKDIKLLILLGCNSGHYTYYNKNIANAFSKKITGAVIASDGTVWFKHNYSYTSSADTYIRFESRGDDEFVSWAKALKDSRDNYGWIIYNQKKSSPKKTCLKVLKASTLYMWYNRQVWK